MMMKYDTICTKPDQNLFEEWLKDKLEVGFALGVL